MEWFDALVLGIIEGITEYLPVSSTGHLLVAQRLLGLPADAAANAYAICIQAGAIAAVLGLYARRVGQMTRGIAGRDPQGARLVLCLLLAFMPAAVVGTAFDERIEAYLFGPWPIVTAWVAGAGLILLLWRSPNLRGQRTLGGGRTALGLEALTPQQAVWIGVAQCAALWPGTSRSLATIAAGAWLGLSLPAAVEFSFLLGVITLGAATAYKAVQSGGAMLASYGWTTLLVGFVAAWLSATLAVSWMVNYLHRHGMRLFAYWRLGAAALVATLLLTGVL